MSDVEKKLRRMGKKYDNVDGDICDYGCGKRAEYIFNNGKKSCKQNPIRCIGSIRRAQEKREKTKNENRDYSFNNTEGIVCEFGCGKLAAYKPVHGKYCCEKNYIDCIGFKEFMSNSKKEEYSNREQIKNSENILCDFCKTKQAKYKFKNGKYCCEPSPNICCNNRPKSEKLINNTEIKCSYGCDKLAEYKYGDKYCCVKNPEACTAKIKRSKFKIKLLNNNTDILCGFGCGQLAKYTHGRNNYCCEDHFTKCPEYKIKMKKASIKQWEEEPEKVEDKNILCDFCKTKQAKYKFKNGKYCCERSTSSCSSFKLNAQIFDNPEKLKCSWCDKEGKYIFPSTNNICCEDSHHKCLGYLTKRIEKLSFGLKELKKRYPIFCKEEDPKENSEGKLLVKCKNSNCGKYFAPTRPQLFTRIYSIEKNQRGQNYFYCSDSCKNSCSLYNFHVDHYLKKLNNKKTMEGITDWLRKIVLERDNFECQICGDKENLKVHHIEPKKLQPLLSHDIENMITLCKKCHNRVHKDECSTGKLANIVCSGEYKNNEK